MRWNAAAYLISLVALSSSTVAADEIDDRILLWTACVEKQALQYISANETAAEVARLAAVKCGVHKTAYILLLAPPDSPLTDLDTKMFANKMARETEAFIIDQAASVVLDARMKAQREGQ